MKMRMKTRMAGSPLATIIQTGKALLSPRGWITQPRFLGSVTEKPCGTDSFCKRNGMGGRQGGDGGGVPHDQRPQGNSLALA